MILTVTWANHYSALVNLDEIKTYSEFSLIGIDGIYLRYLLNATKERSSADLVIPSLLQSTPLRVSLVGSSRSNQQTLLKEFANLYPLATIVGQMNGYDELCVNALSLEIEKKMPQVVVVGLGPLLQEQFVVELVKSLNSRNIQGIVIVTCGGWLDQVVRKNYYPGFAYKLKINWLIRLLKEPRRLWKRYTYFGVIAWKRKSELREYFQKLNGFISLEGSKDEIESLILQFLQE